MTTTVEPPVDTPQENGETQHPAMPVSSCRHTSPPFTSVPPQFTHTAVVRSLPGAGNANESGASSSHTAGSVTQRR